MGSVNNVELNYISGLGDVMGDYYPSEIIRVLKNKEVKESGEHR